MQDIMDVFQLYRFLVVNLLFNAQSVFNKLMLKDYYYIKVFKYCCIDTYSMIM